MLKQVVPSRTQTTKPTHVFKCAFKIMGGGCNLGGAPPKWYIFIRLCLMTTNWQTDNLTNKTVCLTPVCARSLDVICGEIVWEEEMERQMTRDTGREQRPVFQPFLGMSQCSWPVQKFLTFSHVRCWSTTANIFIGRWECKCRWISCELTCSLFQLKQLWKVSHVTSRLTWSMWQLTSRDPLSIDNQGSAVEVNVLTNTKVCSVSDTKS